MGDGVLVIGWRVPVDFERGYPELHDYTARILARERDYFGRV